MGKISSGINLMFEKTRRDVFDIKLSHKRQTCTSNENDCGLLFVSLQLGTVSSFYWYKAE